MLEVKVASEIEGDELPEGWLLQNLFSQSAKNAVPDIGPDSNLSVSSLSFSGGVSPKLSKFPDLPEAKIAYTRQPMDMPLDNSLLFDGTPKASSPVGISLAAALPVAPTETVPNLALPPGLEVPADLQKFASPQHTPDSPQLVPPPGLPMPGEMSQSPARLLPNMAQHSASQILLPPEVLTSASPQSHPCFFTPSSGLPSPLCFPGPVHDDDLRVLARFCVTCGEKVDPKYITARFCAYCGSEHGKISAPSSPGRSTYDGSGYSTSVGQASMSPGSSVGETLSLHGFPDGFTTPNKSEYDDEAPIWGNAADDFTAYYDNMMWHAQTEDLSMVMSPNHRCCEFETPYSTHLQSAAW